MAKYQVQETDLKIRGIATQGASIDSAKKELAELHRVKIGDIDHCIDRRTHLEFGKNKKFIALREKATGIIYLARLTRGGNSEIIPYKYLASLLHKTTASGEERYVHFYLKR